MIKITIQKQQNSISQLKIAGHANSGPYNHDLVCAGITAIGTGTLNALDTLLPNDCELVAKDGLIVIKVIKSSELLQSFLQFMLVQLQTIEQQYSKYVVIKEVRSNDEI